MEYSWSHDSLSTQSTYQVKPTGFNVNGNLLMLVRHPWLWRPTLQPARCEPTDINLRAHEHHLARRWLIYNGRVAKTTRLGLTCRQIVARVRQYNRVNSTSLMHAQLFCCFTYACKGGATVLKVGAISRAKQGKNNIFTPHIPLTWGSMKLVIIHMLHTIIFAKFFNTDPNNYF